MHLALHAGDWVRRRGVAVRGRAFDGDRLLEGAALAECLARAIDDGGSDGTEGSVDDRRPTSPTVLTDVASSLEGFFAVVIESSPHTYLVADGARSIPLWYDAGGTIVSDRGWAVRDRLEAPRNPVTESEFLLTRYVTGPATIWADVFAVQPGEIVCLGDDGITRHTYREYWPAGPRRRERADGASEPAIGDVHGSLDDALRSLEAGLEHALDRLEVVAGDRPIVLPLSGGLDSRLLAAALVERDRKVIAFTFGRSGHPDVEVSREVAAELGTRWEFAPYSRAAWREWYHGDAARYRRWAFGGDALPFLAEWPAVHGLLEEGRLPEEALYCPGHTVATPSERLPRFAGPDEKGSGGEDGTDDPSIDCGCGPAVDADEAATVETVDPSLEGLTEYVLESHYGLWEWDDEAFRRAARDRIGRGLLGDRSPEAIAGPETAAGAYERWEWRGRMSTFTNGDLRVYEDAGLEWWLPLWDPAYVRAWERVPADLRRGKGLHAELAIETYRRVAGVSRRRAERTDRTLEPADRLLSLVRHTPVRQFTERDGDWEPPFLAPRQAWREPGNHPLAWDGAVADAVLEAVPTSRNFYALRTLAETGYLDLDPELDQNPENEGTSWLPEGESLRLPTTGDPRVETNHT